MPDQPPWPVSPRPFIEEAMGSWIGRVAARYRMDVRQLLERYQINVSMNTTNVGWMLCPFIEHGEIERLAKLARLDTYWLQSIQTPPPWVADWRSCLYCAQCVFLNPADVTAPMWKREWFDPEARTCRIHGQPLQRVTPGKLHGCKNFGHVVKLVSRIEEMRRLEARYGLH
jgi:TniQ